MQRRQRVYRGVGDVWVVNRDGAKTVGGTVCVGVNRSGERETVSPSLGLRTSEAFPRGTVRRDRGHGNGEGSPEKARCRLH